ncbi:MAG: DUF2892 domain-containing protein, partial [Caldilineae bacterium]
MFSLNMGSTDRIIRVVLGVILLAVGFFVLSGTWKIVLGVVGVILLVTAAIGWC